MFHDWHFFLILIYRNDKGYLLHNIYINSKSLIIIGIKCITVVISAYIQVINDCHLSLHVLLSIDAILLGLVLFRYYNQSNETNKAKAVKYPPSSALC
jgi:hypothetical protein